MIRTFTFSIVCLAFSSLSLKAQEIKQVFVDNTKRTFSQTSTLPAGSNFFLTGSIASEISKVKTEIFRKSNKNPLYENQWRRHYSDNSPSFYIPVDLKLQPNSNYNIRFRYYKTLEGKDLELFREKLHFTIQSYVDAVTTATDKRIQLNGSVEENMIRLNRVITQAFTYYESFREESFPGFSDLVELKLEQLKEAGLQNARYNVNNAENDSLTTDFQLKQQYAFQLKNELVALLKAEADGFLGAGVYTQVDDFTVNNFQTEKSRTFLPLNIGYGAAYLGGSLNNLDYSSQPYAGISLPFGNPKINRFLGNASFSFGVFLRNFEDKEGNEITGPIVNRPFYAGLGYKIFDFIKLNAGLTATSTEKIDADNFSTEKIGLRPFVGISAEFNLSIGTR